MHNSFCRVPLPGLVYARPKSKEEFDRLPFSERVHDWAPDSTETVLRNDGLEYEHRLHVKSLEIRSGDNINQFEVIFQWFEYRVAEGLVDLQVQVPQA
ncbi:hypothetical protein FUT69_01415 [Xylella taiwanensis]|uniref:Uncharacterized protein n=1 Tax=Xylella taiwanensis TaxID=1444770 RepID=Z9JKW8_9GAMM|nr:hypothetical protein [Xylella taiwanensis]AXI84210.1 hypothetical protein AB672_09810 [Xylella taiwanensis]EWS78844.1 hypothetical protein AF72_03010 [Xylella taiwanensis]MCD8457326.1 hypothetical protein [Xylella taiwanensis]MCD8459737.1 hypothetical protein [Xylella taiwanensis]MCD8461393.1 hypothetical protein [Xylella taiwanensis]